MCDIRIGGETLGRLIVLGQWIGTWWCEEPSIASLRRDRTRCTDYASRTR